MHSCSKSRLILIPVKQTTCFGGIHTGDEQSSTSHFYGVNKLGKNEKTDSTFSFEHAHVQAPSKKPFATSILVELYDDTYFKMTKFI